MNASGTFRTTLLATAAAAMLLTAGCASTLPTADKMQINPMGTVLTYHRKSSGSLGNFDGQVVWTQAPATWQGKPVISSGAPQAGVGLHDPVSFGLMANLNPAGQPLMSFEPPIDYPWPLQVGKTWTVNHTVTLYPSGNKLPLKVDGKVESFGDVTVPAGTFRAFKLVWSINQNEFETRWIAPNNGLATIKRHVERPASHPQGAGVLDAELISRVLPTQ
ncbi:MAG: hypothetical protein Q7U52_04070 [Hydrogenophaga sp.]|uniref:hypothetical protein n=1 Tax=Hydrogenophaga sp. TaxID=1904254 RepID=UPI0027246387|nr:hypothetical protein [Hydrogenophaga sp.]MDO9146833.1 hypothetical protein [Hydrogenophaga sp.]MDO9603993.1 hypothetical protein [Hydrogenophaga sp.]